jgi:dephospho-CoA kinase|eukprot:g803.t1
MSAGANSKRAHRRKVVIGLTGGIASGKSTISKILESFGAQIVDADKIGHKVYLPGTDCLKSVVETFGEHLLLPDGTLNRKALGSVVFDPKAPENLKRLNAIVWPYIEKEIEREISEHKGGVLVIEAAVMVEAGWALNNPNYDELWVAWTDVDTAKRRIMDRNSLSAEESLKRIRSQITNEERLKHADVSIENDGSPLTLEDRVKQEWGKMIERLGVSDLDQSSAKRAKGAVLQKAANGTAAVTAALLKFPFKEEDRQVNSEIIVQAVKRAPGDLHCFFCTPKSQEESAANALKCYVGDAYLEIWDAALAAGKPHLASFIGLPLPGYTSADDHFMADGIEDFCFVDNDGVTKDFVKHLLLRRGQLGKSEVRCHSLTNDVRHILDARHISFDDRNTALPVFDKVVLGGTFDHLHNGHKRLLTMTAMVCKNEVTIGVTSSEMLKKKKFASEIESLEQRIEGVAQFFKALKPGLKVNIVKIDDPFGPSITDSTFNAITCSAETVKGCEKINQIRLKRNLPALDIVFTKRGQSYTLSSTFIRNNLHDRRNQGSSRL